MCPPGRGERKKKIPITKITLTEKDGTETVIDMTEGLHYFFVFTKADSKEGGFVPVEILLKGSLDIGTGQFYQFGETRPSLTEHCAKRAFVGILEQLRFKNAAARGTA